MRKETKRDPGGYAILEAKDYCLKTISPRSNARETPCKIKH